MVAGAVKVGTWRRAAGGRRQAAGVGGVRSVSIISIFEFSI